MTKLIGLPHAALLLTVVVATVPARASAIFGTDLPASSASDSLEICCTIEQSFSLTTPIQVSSIAVDLSGFGTGTFTLWLTNAIGSGTSLSNVLFQTVKPFPATATSVSGVGVVAATNLALSPGNYYLVLSSASPSSAQEPAWLGASTTLPTAVGTIGSAADSCCVPLGTNTSFAPASTFSNPTFELAFQLTLASTVPEPGTLLLLGLGFAGIVGLQGMRFKN